MNAQPNRQQRYLRPSEERLLKQDLQNLESTERSLRAVPRDDYDQARVAKSRQNIQRALESQTPPDLSGPEKDRAAKLVTELEEKIREGMPSSEEMRRNPPGAVDAHMRWERRNKQNLRDWKQALRALHKGDPDTSELCNVERLRPRTSQLNMENAQIPVQRTYHELSGISPDRWAAIFDDSPERRKEAYERVIKEQEERIRQLEEQRAAENAKVAASSQHQRVDKLTRNMQK